MSSRPSGAERDAELERLSDMLARLARMVLKAGEVLKPLPRGDNDDDREDNFGEHKTLLGRHPAPVNHNSGH